MARLKAAREHRGITLDQIAQTTKVSASLLAALERGDLSRWPKGIFRRSFFRDYLAAIGLPADPHMARFVAFFPDEDDFGRPKAGPHQASGDRVLDQALGWIRRALGPTAHGELT